MEELLSCAICLNNMSNRINLCIQGHSVCCICYNNLGLCPYCRSPWSRTRNRNLEKLVTYYLEEKRTNDLINNENLKCPKCHVLMDGGIMLCGDGHSFCAKCAKYMHQCLLCNKLICYKRNFSLEKFIDSVKNQNEEFSALAKVQACLLKLLKLLLWFIGFFSLLRYTMYIFI